MSDAPEEPVRVEVRGDEVFMVGTRSGASQRTGKLVPIPGGLRYTKDVKVDHYFVNGNGFGISTCILDFFGVHTAYRQEKGFRFRTRMDDWFQQETDPTIPKVVEVEIVAFHSGFKSTLRSKLWRWSADSGICSTTKNTVWPGEGQTIMPDTVMECTDSRTAVDMIKIEWREIRWPKIYGKRGESNGRI